LAQSSSLEAFFAPDGELHDVFREVFPVRCDVYDLVFCRLAIKTDEESGDDLLYGTFQVITWDAAREHIANIWEQELDLLRLAAAVGEDVYQVREFRLYIRPEVVKTRLLRFARGLAVTAAARFPEAARAKDILPETIL